MPELYDLCDEMGFLVMDEAFDEWEGPKNKWSTGHNVYPPKHQGYYKYFPQYQKEDLSAMVLRDRNHPSVILWSIGNEIDYPNDPYCHPLFQTMTGNNDANKPAAERVYNPDRPNAERLKALAPCLLTKYAQWILRARLHWLPLFRSSLQRSVFWMPSMLPDTIIKNIYTRKATVIFLRSHYEQRKRT